MFRLIIPLLWPRHNLQVKALVVFSLLSVITGCVVNFYVPICIQKIVDNLTYVVTNQTQEICWELVLIFVILKVCQGVGSLSLVTALEQIMWLPIEHHVRRLIQVRFFRHIHSMSLNWMVNTKIGDILGALERGTDSITSTIEHLLYSIIPTLVDIVIAIIYLSVRFGWIYGLITGLQISLYVFFTAFAIERHAKYQALINEQENELRQRTLESVINYETVKCFGNEEVEKSKYSSGLNNLQSKKFCIGILTNLLQTAQQTVISVGLLLCSLLALSSVVHKGELTAGDYVLCTMYLGQLYGPLNYLAGYYRELRVNLINAKSMMDYFGEESSIQDAYYAKELKINEGAIEFRDVCLVTDSGEAILEDISFLVEPNTTVALVGCTGSGKTSVLKLLIRLYDPICGKIFIDGTDIKNVTLESLRRSVGIIPQNCDLFNDSIRNNIRYGDLTASDFDVTFAAALTGMHEKILSMPDGYDTNVGERAARLSGGQRQLIAISRAILQNPKILILDEPFSALDVTTEKQIHEVMNHLCKNRTCLMITHNLASTVNVDCIIVLKDGKIVERGSYQNLMKKKGHFAAMWNASSRR